MKVCLASRDSILAGFKEKGQTTTCGKPMEGEEYYWAIPLTQSVRDMVCEPCLNERTK